MALKHYVGLFWRWLWLLILCGLCAGSIAYLISINTAPVYAASTTLQINPARIGAASDYNALLSSNLIAKTYAELLRKRPVLEAVVTNLALQTTPDELVERLRISVVRDTQLIQLKVEDHDPQRAADIANEVVRVFSLQNQQQQTGRYIEAKKSLEQEIAQLQLNIDQTQSSLDHLAPGLVDRLTEQRRLQELLAQYRTSYATLFKSLSDVRLAEVQATDTIALVEPAKAEPEPIRPRPLTNSLFAAIMGLLLAAGVVLLIAYLDDTIHSSEELSNLTGLAPLAVIGRLDEREEPNRLVMMSGGARSVNAEAYVGLRVNLAFAAVDEPAQTILVTSAGPGEGKSTTAANLALAIAQAGKRVILVDTDLRRGSLHRLFDLPNEHGLTTALFAHDEDITAHMQPHKTLSHLRLLTSGPLPPNPVELLSSQRMAALFEQLKHQADMVVFDSPPVLAVVDAALLGRACDATILVVLAGQTRRSAVKQAGEQLVQADAQLVGVVLNRVVRRQQHDYRGYATPRTAVPPQKGSGWRRTSSAAQAQSSDEFVRNLPLPPAVPVPDPPAEQRPKRD